MLIFLTQ